MTVNRDDPEFVSDSESEKPKRDPGLLERIVRICGKTAWIVALMGETVVTARMIGFGCSMMTGTETTATVGLEGVDATDATEAFVAIVAEDALMADPLNVREPGTGPLMTVMKLPSVLPPIVPMMAPEGDPGATLLT